MLELKTAQFAKLYLIGEKFNEPAEANLTTDNVVPSQYGDSPNSISKVEIGIAQNIRINSTFGSTSVNVIGTPLNVLVPGYFQSEISIDKATLDDKAFTSMNDINPLKAYLPNSYDFGGGSLDLRDDQNSQNPLIDLASDKSFNIGDPTLHGKIPRFVFAIAIYDEIQQAYSRPTGIYIALLRTVGQTLSANDAVIIQGITAVARPVVGGWTAVAKEVYNNSPFFGYTTSLSSHLV